LNETRHPYLPNVASGDFQEMLREIGVNDVWELYRDVPRKYILDRPPDIEGPLSEAEVYSRVRGILSKNRPLGRLKLFIGGGVWPHYIPAVVKEILGRSEFLTSYTPYQPEASQGVLTALFEYQSMVSELYGVDVVNSSMYDWATAVGEAFRMAYRYNGRKRIIVSEYIARERLQVAKTYTEPLGVEILEVRHDRKGMIDLEELKQLADRETSAVYVENPTYLGTITTNVKEAGEIAHDVGALFIVGAEPTSLGLLKPPGEYGADIVVGEGQPLGLPMSFGGPLLGILGCRMDMRLIHSMPGRLIGMTEDMQGRRAFTMILQAREQHIRREKATSNICTNQALCAVAAACYLALLGKSGIRKLAEHIFSKTAYTIELFRKLDNVEAPLVDAPHYMEFTYRVKGVEPAAVLAKLLEHDIVGGIDLSSRFPKLGGAVLTCVTEIHSLDDIREYAEALNSIR